jgi:hypothetical protein
MVTDITPVAELQKSLISNTRTMGEEHQPDINDEVTMTYLSQYHNMGK